MSPDSRRRALLAALSALLAGCVTNTDTPGDGDDLDVPIPSIPTYEKDLEGLSQPLRYFVESLEYQNEWFDDDEPGALPEFDGDRATLSDEIRFFVESLEYQNAMMYNDE